MIFFTYVVVLPLLFSGMAWQHVILGFVLMQMLAGLILACVFQLAHVMHTSDYAEPDDANKMPNSWAVHQLLNTANFSPKSKIMSWFIGGLNYQIEHHLFPHICHVHYPQLSKIVSQTAKEYNLPYNVQPTFVKALAVHANMLKQLGKS
jgi:linoleoyl-CoA desaturase